MTPLLSAAADAAAAAAAAASRTQTDTFITGGHCKTLPARQEGEARRRVMGECGDWNRIVIRAGFKVGQTGQLPRASTSRGAPQKQ